MSFRDWMIHTVAVQPEVRTADTKTGAPKITYPATSKTLSCFVDPATTEEFVEFREKRIKITHRVYFIDDPGIDETVSLLFKGTRRLWILGVKNTAESDELWLAECAEGIQGNWT